MPRRRGPLLPAQAFPGASTVAGASNDSRPVTRSSARLSQRQPVQYAQLPLPPPEAPRSNKRKAAKVDSSQPISKKLKLTKPRRAKSLVVTLRIPKSASSSADQDLGLPSPAISTEEGTSGSPFQLASAAATSYRETFAPTKTTSKRGRPSVVRAPCVSKTKATPKDETRPDPCGFPLAWAVDRPSLCETLPWFRVREGGGYAFGKYAYGYLIDGDSGDRRHMDHEVIITRAGGGENGPDGEGGTRQNKDHDRNNSMIRCFINSMKDGVPIGVVVGISGPCPTRPLHRYSVLAFFHLTAFWAEKNNGKICFKYRFEKIELNEKSWWAPVGTANPPPTRDYEAKAVRKICQSCHEQSPQVYVNGWMCLQEHCGKHWQINGAEPPVDMDFNPAFVNERNLYADKEGLPDLLPEMPDPMADAMISTERNSWKGLVCPKCQACTARADWNSWRCETDGCGFVLPVKHTLRNYHSLLLDHQVEITGRALSLDTWTTPIQAPTVECLGGWRIQTFSIPGLGDVMHLQSNAHINRKAGGPHQMLEDLQKADLELRRHKMKCARVFGTRCAHFSHDYGMAYNYIVGQENTALEDAPAVVKNALGRMTWAGRHHANGAKFVDYNEVLALGYFEGGKIGYHDDGEESLAGTIATMSIGADADMSLRFKGKYYFTAKTTGKVKKYEPDTPIFEGFQDYKARLELKALYDEGRLEEYEAAKDKLLEDHKSKKQPGQPPAILKINLKHGDFVVMPGGRFQKYTEHQIEPNAAGKMRYALTARHVNREFVPEDQHWKGDFIIPDEYVYDGDIDIMSEVRARRLAAANTEGDNLSKAGEEV